MAADPRQVDPGAGLTRGDLLVRGAVAFAAVSPLFRDVARAATAIGNVNPGVCALGAYANPQNAALTLAESQHALAGLESLVGHRLKIASTFVAWDEFFPNSGHVADRDAGRRPLIAWESPSELSAVTSGHWDALISERARACREFGAPLYVRWGAEFNGAWNPNYGNAKEFVAAWRHIVRGFRAAGASNVRWVWCPFAVDGRRTAADDWRAYYPGDRFVDWVGMDGYNWGTARAWSRWQTFDQVFAPLYADYAGRKPLMICETASAEVGGDKAAWIEAMGTQLAGPFSKIKAIVWFDSKKETDWRVNSSAAALDAFRAVVSGARYS